MDTAAATPPLVEKLIDYIQDTYSLKRHARTSLDSLMATTSDPEVLTRLRLHARETEKHTRLLADRLAAHGASASPLGDAAVVAPALVKGVVDQVRPDRQGKVGRDLYISEQVEIAALSQLGRLANRAGDLDTARAAAFIRAED